jgi:hypothetical protein
MPVAAAISIIRSDVRVLAQDAERRAVRHPAVAAGVDRAYRHHDHLALGARQPGLARIRASEYWKNAWNCSGFQA